MGPSLVRLAPDAGIPDSTFVADAAIVTARGAILTRPGAPSRAGEVASLAPALRPWFPELDAITAPGTVDGGDTCEAGERFFIGRSARTNAEGAAQIAEWLAGRGFGSSVIAGKIAGAAALRGWEVVRVPDGAEYAANRIMVNDWLLVPRGFPATASVLDGLGYDVVPLEMSEYRKMDGGLSSLSVRW